MKQILKAELARNDKIIPVSNSASSAPAPKSSNPTSSSSS
jgi:hypothetical protein